jgi:hypothetical protein
MNNRNDEPKFKKIFEIPISEIDAFPKHPFKVKNDEDMSNITNSIRQNGVLKDVHPVESFGNQRNFMENYSTITAKKGNWFYGADEEFRIIKTDIKELNSQKTVYTEKDKNYTPCYVSVSDGWIYFIDDAEENNHPLCRVKEDGSNKTTLLHDLPSYKYVLTDKGIYYEENNLTGTQNIRVVDLDGGHDRNVIRSVKTFDGIDNGWIYYQKGKNYDVYRTRLDGTDSERVLDGTNVWDYYVDGGQVFFIYCNKKDEYLLIKESNGKKTTLTTVSYTPLENWCLNKEDDQLYFADENKVYKIDLGNKDKKKLVYSFKKDDHVGSISLYDSNVFITSSSKMVYIKRDGTVIDLGNY